MMNIKKPTIALILFFVSTAAWAHPGHGVGGLIQGFLHPMNGLDHLMTAVAVGVWAAQIGGQALFAFPAVFVLAMVLGGFAGFDGYSLPFQESGILLSMTFLGFALLLSFRMSIRAALPIIALFGILQGNAHGSEMASGLSAASYSLGFTLSTSLLHMGGIAGVILMKRILGESYSRYGVQALGTIIVASAGLMGLGVF